MYIYRHTHTHTHALSHAEAAAIDTHSSMHVHMYTICIYPDTPIPPPTLSHTQRRRRWTRTVISKDAWTCAASIMTSVSKLVSTLISFMPYENRSELNYYCHLLLLVSKLIKLLLSFIIVGLQADKFHAIRK